jgi:hypothetical protein
MLLSILGLPEDTAAAARPALRLMLLWPALIAWRRLCQGLLVRHGQGRYVTLASGFRLVTAVVVVTVGVWRGGLSGAVVGSLALLLAVGAEAVAITWWALPVVRNRITNSDISPTEGRQTYASLYSFYAPLAVTEVLSRLSGPLVVAGIARSGAPELSLAAWPVSFGLARIISVGAIPVQEVSIKALADGLLRAQLVRFSLTIGMAFSLVLSLLAFTPAGHVYFARLIQIPPEVEGPALLGAQLLVLYPLLLAVRSQYRGQLIDGDGTRYVQFAMGVNVACLAVGLGAGVALTRAPGIVLGAAATIAAHLAEVGVLYVGSRLSGQATVRTFTA